MRRFIRGLISTGVIFCCILAGCNMIPASSFAGDTAQIAQGGWHNNLLKEEHGAEGRKKDDGSWPDAKKTVFGIDTWIREQIQGVVVQDTLAGMPDNAADLSAAGNGLVRGWLDEYQILHIAGEGGVMAPADSSALFAHMVNVRSIDLRGLHTENSYDMSFFFYHCENLEKVNLEGIVTDNVTDLTRMFTHCYALKSVDLSGFNTQNVVDFSAMFQNCSALQELNLISFHTESATNFWMMFRGCSNLRHIYWNPQFFVTDRVTKMSLMFYDCTSLEYVDVSEFNLASMKDMDSAFYNCRAIQGIDTSRWDMSNVDDAAHLFGECASLVYIDTQGWNMKPGVDKEGIFAASGLEKYGSNGETLIGSQAGSHTAPQTGGQTTTAGNNKYTAEQAALILHKFCDSYATDKAITYIQDEYLEDEHTYVLWFRSYTGFTTKYCADLITGSVTASGPYNGQTPAPELPFSEDYYFNLGDDWELTGFGSDPDPYVDDPDEDWEDDEYDQGTDWEDEGYVPDGIDNDTIDMMLSGVPVKLGGSLYLDLDQDGILEDISLMFENDPYTSNDTATYYYGRYWITVDNDTLEGGGENLHDSLYGVSLDGETIDLIVYQEGPSDDPVCDFYHYDGSGLTYAGSIEDSVRNLIIDSDYIVKSDIRTNIMDTSYMVVYWEKQDDGMLHPIEQEYYEMHNGLADHMDKGLYYATLLYPLEVYEDMDYDSECYELPPQHVWFPYTDNENWVYVEAEDGSGGWLDLSGWDYKDRGIYFEGLLFAD